VSRVRLHQAPERQESRTVTANLPDPSGTGSWVSRIRSTAPAGIVGLLLGMLALGPGLAPGYLLSYDMVFVPRPPFNAAMFGLGGTLPRAVPSDAVVTMLAHVLPADFVQKLLLLAIFVLACSGVAVLLRAEHWMAQLAAGVCYAWNPFVAERLILGQWALLLGYAGLPWVLRSLTSPAATRWRQAGLLALALVPAAIGGFSAMCVSGLVVLPVAASGTGQAIRERVAAVVAALGVLTVLSLPWLVPALTRTVLTSPAGAAAFAARADTPFGSAGSLLMLGGVWNAQVVPAGYGGTGSALWLVLVLAAIGSFALLGRHRWPGLGFAAVAGFAVAAVGVTGGGQGVLRSMIAFWPGFAVLRDGQQFVAPLALAEAAGVGLGVSWLMRRPRPFGMKEGKALIGIALLIAPIVLLPGLAWGAGNRLRPVQYPADWLVARNLIDSDRARGDVLLLPWAAYRRFGWNGGEAVLDPWPRLVRRQVIWNDAVQVGAVTIPGEDPRARALDGLIASAGPLTLSLEKAGIRYVIVDAGFAQSPPGVPQRRVPGAASPGSYPYLSRLPGCQIVLAGPGLVLYRLPDSQQAR